MINHRADSNKAARRSTAVSPRAEQQQQQQMLLQQQGSGNMGVWFAQQQQQQQQQQAGLTYRSPFMQFSFDPSQPQQQQQQFDAAAGSTGLNTGGSFQSMPPGAAGFAFGSVQQLTMDSGGTSADNQQAPPANAAAAAAAAGDSAKLQLGGLGDTVGGGCEPSGFVALAQMQQLQISSMAQGGPGSGGYTLPSSNVGYLGEAGAGGGYTLPSGFAAAEGSAASGGADAAGAAASGMGADPSAAAAAGGDGVPAWQMGGGRLKSETKTKYADGE
jgi:hypothetical protein